MKIRNPADVSRYPLLLTDTVQGALLLAHEFLEGLGLPAAERRNRGGRLPGRRTGGRGADRPPEL